MRRQLAIFFLMLHFSVNTEAGQLLHMPSLIRHYHKHQQKQGGISFSRFLLMHYAGDDGKDADHDTLPFHDFFHSSVALVYAPMISQIASISIPVYILREKLQDHREPLLSSWPDRILQPPKA